MARKLGRPTDQRMAVLKNQTSDLLWNGRIETTLQRAKEIRRIAERCITLAIRTYEDTVEITKEKENLKGEKVQVNVTNDGVKKLAARRQLMSKLIDLQEKKGAKESNSAYKARTKDVKHPLIEKLFNELAPKYDARAKECGQGGGYTRIIKTGFRRGDAAEMAIIELVK